MGGTLHSWVPDSRGLSVSMKELSEKFSTTLTWPRGTAGWRTFFC